MINFCFHIRCCTFGFLLGVLGTSVVWAQVEEVEGETVKSGVDLEIAFFHHVVDDLRLYRYAPLILEELKQQHPEAGERIQVAQAALDLRLGKVDTVEKWLATRKVETDPKAQAVLLQLGLTYDSLGKAPKAQAAYSQFLKINAGKTITDPDVARVFGVAAMRLGALQMEAGDTAGAAKTFQLVVNSTENKTLKRKFTYLLCDAYLQTVSATTGAKQAEAAKKLDTETENLMWIPDNYYYQAVGLQSLAKHKLGKTEEGLARLNELKKASIEMEKTMTEKGIPTSEFPRAVMRYAEGMIYFDQAKEKAKAGEDEEAKALASKAAGHLYNAFLKYGEHEYAKRAGIQFEAVKAWVEQSLGVDTEKSREKTLGSGELIFSRQLDLAKEQLRLQKYAEAEETLVDALGQYPITKYSVEALEILGRALHAQKKYMVEVALADYLSEFWPEDPEAGKVLLRIGGGLYKDLQFSFPSEQVLATFGRTYRDNPKAAKFLFQMGYMADQNGRKADAQEYYQEVVRLYPGSSQAIKAQERRANEALTAGNIAGAAQTYDEIMSAAPRGPDRARVAYKLAEVLLRLDEPDIDRSLSLFKEVIAKLDPAKQDRLYYGDERAKAVSTETYEDARYGLSRAYLLATRLKGEPELQELAEKEIKSFLEDYPKGERAPESMFNLGRLLLQQGKTAEAQEVFNDLSKEYADTEFGKDALYALVKAALDEEQIAVAEEAVRGMLEKADQYELDKIRRVARLMLDEKQFGAAYEAYELIVNHPAMKADPKKAQLEIYRLAEAGIGVGKVEEASVALEKIIKDYPNTSLVVDAGLKLAAIYADAGDFAKADAALAAVGKVVGNLKDRMFANMRYKLAVGRVFHAKGDTKKALNTLINVALQKPENPEQSAIVKMAIEEALTEAKTLTDAGEDSVWTYIVELTDLYIQSFPLDEASKLEAMQALRREAFMKSDQL